MIIKTKKNIPSSEITDPQVFRDRRKIIQALLALTTASSGIESIFAESGNAGPERLANNGSSENLVLTPKKLIQNYTNYYEFAFNKQDATKLAQKLPIDPWSVEISGEVEKGGVFALEDIISQQTLQEHIYRFRCVEAWSMVVPWMGFPLRALLGRVQPLSTAKFVKFTSVYWPDVMPNQKNDAMLDWPYVEGLRIDEAMHPLTLLAVGLYGDSLPKQNGTPLRLVVPWKYGFKSIKAIVKIELLKTAPLTSWNSFSPMAYGFYANVNPAVPHPRWSQYSERVLGGGYFTPRRQTEIFNGYGEQVAGLYAHMDLHHFF